MHHVSLLVALHTRKLLIHAVNTVAGGATPSVPCQNACTATTNHIHENSVPFPATFMRPLSDPFSDSSVVNIHETACSRPLRGFVSRTQRRNSVSQSAEIQRQLDEKDQQIAQYCVQLRDQGQVPNLDLFSEEEAQRVLALIFFARSLQCNQWAGHSK